MAAEVVERKGRSRWDQRSWPAVEGVRLVKSKRKSRWDRPRALLPLRLLLAQDLDLSALDLEGAIFKILTCLPLHKIYELRTVCKAWNALLSSPAFLRAWSSPFPAERHEEDGGWLVMVRKKPGSADESFARELIAYDLTAERWMSLDPLLHSFPSPALSILGGPSLQCVVNPLRFEDLPSFCQFGAWAHAPGLVCFLTSPIMSNGAQLSYVFSLLVVNLLTGSYHNLPPPLKHHKELVCGDSCRISMQPLPDNAYRVFLQAKRRSFPGPLEIYDSRSRRWKAGKSCDGPREAKIATAADVEGADLLQFLNNYKALFAYRAASDEWRVIQAQFPADAGMDDDHKYSAIYHLVRYRGRIFLAEAGRAAYSFRGFIVWELRMRAHSVPPVAAIPGADWVKMSRTPQHLWTSYSRGPNDYFEWDVKVISSGSVICMTAVHYTDSNDGGIYYPPLVYDLVGNSWYQLPSYKGGNDFLGAFALQPNYIASA